MCLTTSVSGNFSPSERLKISFNDGWFTLYYKLQASKQAKVLSVVTEPFDTTYVGFGSQKYWLGLLALPKSYPKM